MGNSSDIEIPTLHCLHFVVQSFYTPLSIDPGESNTDPSEVITTYIPFNEYWETSPADSNMTLKPIRDFLDSFTSTEYIKTKSRERFEKTISEGRITQAITNHSAALEVATIKALQLDYDLVDSLTPGSTSYTTDKCSKGILPEFAICFPRERSALSLKPYINFDNVRIASRKDFQSKSRCTGDYRLTKYQLLTNFLENYTPHRTIFVYPRASIEEPPSPIEKDEAPTPDPERWSISAKTLMGMDPVRDVEIVQNL